MAITSPLRNLDRISADEYCAVIQLNRALRMEGETLVAECLGLDTHDPKWIGPDGRDLTRLCELSSLGGFSSEKPWTFNGWVLDEESMAMLQEEYPEHFRSSVDRPMPKQKLKKKLHRIARSLKVR